MRLLVVFLISANLGVAVIDGNVSGITGWLVAGVLAVKLITKEDSGR